MKQNKLNERYQILKSVTVLYVEDEDEIRQELSLFLKKRLKTLYTAKNGEEGLIFYNKHKPDIVVTDVRMPIMDGLEMAKSIKAVDANTPIFVTTAFNEQEYFIQSIEIGVDKYLLKPINPFLLLDALIKSATIINQQKETERNNLYTRFILDFNPIFIITTEGNKIEYINQTFLDFLGYLSFERFCYDYETLEELFCKIDELKYPFGEDFRFPSYLDSHSEKNVIVYLGECFINARGSGAFAVTYKKFPESDKYIFAFTDITKFEKEKQDLQAQATTDALTGLCNRKRFDEVLRSEFQRAIRYNLSLCLIMLDIDHFKMVNDTYGHQVGDSVLRELSALITDGIREIDCFARWGGEEFMILAPSGDIDSAVQFAERLRLIIENHAFSDVGHITSSFGVVQLLPDDTIDSFTKRVDQALYQAKAGGRNRVAIG